ncbi:hypothetical protein NLM24_24620 [Nocardia zapadnayensis]|uniref:WXG100 family type VII secretion target n=1 Tax=Nocardia rhamnosiphila TaxID=426716 RepID=UPI002244FDD4|nr:hypothetical protein [Nocardia zapadnayensis]MCX0273815.1 hypothetical protein [Nocardia zapadnayensis]
MAEGVAAPTGGNITEADEDVLMEFGKKMEGPLQTLEGHLKSLSGSQGTLQTAFKGNAGNAVYNAFGNVLQTGSKVAEYIEQIMQMILSSSSKFGQEDHAAMQSVISRLGEAGDGTFNSGATGSWNNLDKQGNVELESTQGPSKAKVDWA